MESRLDKAYKMAGLDRDKYPKARGLFETLLKLFDQLGKDEQNYKWAFKEIGELVREAHAGEWSGERAT